MPNSLLDIRGGRSPKGDDQRAGQDVARDSGGWVGRLFLLSPPPEYLISRWVFLRLLGLVYLIAFASLGFQITGLIGEKGILPVGRYLEFAQESRGSEVYRLLPTLCWLNSSDAMLRFLCWGGTVLALLLCLGVAPVPVLVLLWVFYLSLSVAGQTFLSFQWDTLLLETGFLAIFYAPMQLLPQLSSERRPSVVVRWLLWFLLFKLMFLSGITKVVSQDQTWGDWTALTYHYETQPIPTWTSWFAHQLPIWFQKFSCGIMYFIEIISPFFIFVPPRWRVLRWVAGLLLIGLQLLILLTGNYGFFNWLSIALCLTLFDDDVFAKLCLRKWQSIYTASAGRRSEFILKRSLVVAMAVVVFPLSGFLIYREIKYTSPKGRPSRQERHWSDELIGYVQPFRSVNAYGLFRVMTTERPEIVIEGSQDEVTWHEYHFRW